MNEKKMLICHLIDFQVDEDSDYTRSGHDPIKYFQPNLCYSSILALRLAENGPMTRNSQKEWLSSSNA